MTAIASRRESAATKPRQGRPDERLHTLDALRGLAIAVMIVDHMCAFGLGVIRPDGVAGDAMEVTRLTLTRISLPAFMLASGYLLATRLPRARRRLEIALLGVVVSVALESVYIGLGTPDILMVWSLCMAGAAVIQRWPELVIALGFVQCTAWPIGGDWYGYQPGMVAGLLAVGVIVGREAHSVVLDQCDGLPRWVASVGRAPLRWYVGHLVVLIVAALIVDVLRTDPTQALMPITPMIGGQP